MRMTSAMMSLCKSYDICELPHYCGMTSPRANISGYRCHISNFLFCVCHHENQNFNKICDPMHLFIVFIASLEYRGIIANQGHVNSARHGLFLKAWHSSFMPPKKNTFRFPNTVRNVNFINCIIILHCLDARDE